MKESAKNAKITKENGFTLVGMFNTESENDYLSSLKKVIPPFLAEHKALALRNLSELYLNLAIGNIGEDFITTIKCKLESRIILEKNISNLSAQEELGNISREEEMQNIMQEEKINIRLSVNRYLNSIMNNTHSIFMVAQDLFITDEGDITLELNINSGKDKKKLFNISNSVMEIFIKNKLALPNALKKNDEVCKFVPSLVIGSIGLDKLDENFRIEIIKNAQLYLDDWKKRNALGYKFYLQNAMQYTLCKLMLRYRNSSTDYNTQYRQSVYVLHPRDYNIKYVKYYNTDRNYAIYFSQYNKGKAQKFCHYLRLFNNMQQVLSVENSNIENNEVVVNIQQLEYEQKYKRKVHGLQ